MSDTTADPLTGQAVVLHIGVNVSSNATLTDTTRLTRQMSGAKGDLTGSSKPPPVPPTNRPLHFEWQPWIALIDSVPPTAVLLSMALSVILVMNGIDPFLNAEK